LNQALEKDSSTNKETPMRFLFCFLISFLAVTSVNAQKFSIKVSGGVEMPIGIF